MNGAPTALIADDEPLLREVLRRQLAAAWPELQVVAEPRNGLEALEQCEALRPTIAFLDVHMPGMSGIEVAQRIDPRTHRVFVTAFDHYALKAFEAGVLDYLVKPVQPARLAETVARLRERLRREQPALHTQKAAALVRPQAGVNAALRQQLGVRAFFHDAACVQHDQAVQRGDGGQAVRNGDHGLALHQAVQAFLDGGFDLAVERAGGFVQQQDGRVLEHHAGNGHALALAARELDAALAHMGLVAAAALGVGQLSMNSSGLGALGGGVQHLASRWHRGGRRGCCRASSGAAARCLA
jgi:CheY-like chemotaxis protein